MKKIKLLHVQRTISRSCMVKKIMLDFFYVNDNKDVDMKHP
jgi:hypothetical protein